jgi:hypothetical protein
MSAKESLAVLSMFEKIADNNSDKTKAGAPKAGNLHGKALF